LWFWGVLVAGVVPDVDTPEGSGVFDFSVIVWCCLGCVPDVEGVGDFR